MINLNEISDRQIMEMKIGLLQYDYIQTKFSRHMDNEDFRDVFTNFYLSSQGRMRLPENRKPFFEIMFNCDSNIDLIELVNYLYEVLPIDMYEFSFATKLLHTVNNQSPIYDSKVFKYLKKEEQVDFWDIQGAKKDRYGNEISKIEKIKNNWDRLNDWYRIFLPSSRGRSWIDWFDSNFPTYAHISDVKKIDFIIFSCSGY